MNDPCGFTPPAGGLYRDWPRYPCDLPLGHGSDHEARIHDRMVVWRWPYQPGEVETVAAVLRRRRTLAGG